MEEAVEEAMKIWLTAALERGGLGGLVIEVGLKIPLASAAWTSLLVEFAELLLLSLLDGFTILLEYY